ncbi:MAG: hypothetical protein KBD15_00575 [Candidatus Magasanikbacteria bacterium]|nr:hypothetical protein [Candidatus Magasanikbacteria bacterium]
MLSTPQSKAKKIGFVIGIIFLVIIGLAFLFQKKQSGQDTLNKRIPTFTDEQLAEVDTSSWSVFTHPDFAYTFRIPTNLLVARTFSPFDGDDSLLVSGQKKQTLAISKGDMYHIYLFPEGGYLRSDMINKSQPIQSSPIVFLGKNAVQEVYDEENMIIRFTDYHNFRIQVYVKKEHKELWKEVQKIFSLMNIDDTAFSTTDMLPSTTPKEDVTQ